MVSVGTVDAKLQIEFQTAMAAMMAQWKATGKAMEKTMVGIGTKVEKGLVKPLQKAHVAGSKTYGYLKDVGRIVQGIFVSQILYRAILQPIQQAVIELKNFIVQMEQTQLAFEMMLGGAEAGQAFVDAMEDFAAITPFVMEDTTKLARYLLGVGFAANEIIPILTKVTDAMALMGTDPAKLTRLVEALGKIKAYGGATLREIKSIARTGLPIVDILQEQLGLSTQQVRDIARLGIPAEVVIEAILSGIQKRFAGGAARLQRTIGGLLSTISDNMFLISRDIFGGITEIAQESITRIADRLEILRRIIREGGVGALFEEIVPKGLHETFRLLIANLQAIGREIAILFKSLGPFIREFGHLYITLNSLLLPVFLQIIRTISTLLNVISSNTQAVKIFVGALTGMLIVSTIAKAFHMLNTAMRVVYVTMIMMMTTNWIGWIGLVVGALAAWALTTGWVQRKLASLQKTIADIFGLDTENILRPIVEEADDVSGIAASMVDLDKDIEDMGDSAKDTAKEISKIVASFDEVYDITEKKEKKAKKLEFGLDLSGLGMGLDEAKGIGKRTVEELLSGVIDGIRRGRGLRLLEKQMAHLAVPIKIEPIPVEEDLLSYLWRELQEFWDILKEEGLGAALLEWIEWDTFVERFKDSMFWNWLKGIPDWGIWAWFKNIPNWRIWNWLAALPMFQVWTPSFWIEKWVDIEDYGIWKWFRNIENWQIWQWFKDLPAFQVWTPDFWIGHWQEIEDLGIWAWLRNIENWEIWNWFENLLPEFDTWDAQWMINFKDGFLAAWEGIAEGMKKPLNSIIGFINTIIAAVEMGINAILKGLGSIRIPIPNWAQKFVDGMPEFSIPLPDKISLGRITEMAAGGIVNRDQVVRIGEPDVPEMVQPLNKTTMKPFADMIAELISNSQDTTDSDYVIVKASKQDLTNLYRSLFIIKRKETIRGLSD